MITEDIGIIINLSNATVKATVMDALSNMGFRNIKRIDNSAVEQRIEESRKYELLITDMNLQTPASINFVMAMKKNVYPKRLPILLATGEDEKEYHLSSLANGLVDEFIVQPFTIGSFKKRIFKCLFKIIVERIRILVVDDAAAMRNSIRYSLQQIGFKAIDMANSGQEALSLMRVKSYDMVITDLNMPKMTGIELVEVMKKDDALSRIPVLVLTAENEKSQVLTLIKAGVSGYILKPYTLESLQERIIGLSSYLL
jgi:two-component system, chemotaxis family, chemotaxis protein CheY